MTEINGIRVVREPTSEDLEARRLSRREFIKRVIASGAVASSASFVMGGVAGCTPRRAAVAGSVERLITLNVNGQDRRVDVLPQETLATTLRYKLGLTGTKLSCDRAECGACTVMIDGRRVLSCLTLAVMAHDRPVTTIEGLAEGDQLHPMQAAFIEHDAFQCGYCTPGQIVSAVALAKELAARAAGAPEPTDDELRELTSGNLCRCGAYPNILTAIRATRRSRP